MTLVVSLPLLPCQEEETKLERAVILMKVETAKRAKKSATVKIAIWSANHRWLVFGLWIVFTFSLFTIGQIIGTKTLSIDDSTTFEKLEADRAWQVWNAANKPDPNAPVTFSETFQVVVTHPAIKVTDQRFREVNTNIVTSLKNMTYGEGGQTKPLFSQIQDPATAPLTAGLVAPDSSTIRIVASFSTTSRDENSKRFKEAKAKFDEIRKQPNNFQVYIYNGALLDQQVNHLVQEELDGSLIITIPATFIILLIAFGAFVAALVPLFLAITALLAAFGWLAIYSRTFGAVDANTTQLIVLIGLAVGIDYSLFIITRYRSERRKGRNKATAIEIASSTAGQAVFFSGLTVIISLSGLFLIGSPFFVSMAAGTIGVVLVSVVGSLTFLPAVIAILGNGINWGRIPFFGRDKEEGKGFWAKFVGMVMRRPMVWGGSMVILLLLVSYPLLHLKLGNNSLDGLPDKIEGVKAIRLINEKWTQGFNLRMQVMVTGADKPETKAALQEFRKAALEVKGLSPSGNIQFSNDGGTVALIQFLMGGNRNDQLNKDLVNKTRTELIPKYFGSIPGVQGYVAGQAAYTVDTVKQFTDSIPLVFAFVLGLSFILLLVAFHSIVIPIKAIILNLLSNGAAYGVLVLVFQEGWFREQLNFRLTGVIESFVPIFMFTILFGLSMDYHLFILTRIKEARDKGYDSNSSVAQGIAITSGTITSAAAIMVVVFAVFVTLQIIIVKQLGLGLAVAVFVDATIIRCILLPASMRLLGDWNWYMPKFLRWIPVITIEGEPEDEPATSASTTEPEPKEEELAKV
jgi:uncharacterized membrane protein YdfJ with MMPL/SSD domain